MKGGQQTPYDHAIVLTGDGSDTGADAILVEDDNIVAVGTVAELMHADGLGAVSLHGAAVLPGLIKARCYLGQIGYLATTANLGDSFVRDIASAQQRIARQEPDATGRVVGRGHTEHGLEERRSPLRWGLDAVAPDMPCVVHQVARSCTRGDAPVLEETR